jgi:hypothetical protein
MAGLAACGGARAPERCRNWVQNPTLESQAGWALPGFAKLEQGAGGIRSLQVEGAADGAIAQTIPRPKELKGLGAIAIGYARVETRQAMPAADDDVTGELWAGTVNLVDGYSRDGRHFESPYTRVTFTAREVASGCWKRFVTEAIPAGGAKVLHPHFAFWGARIRPGVKLHLAGLALVDAPAPQDTDEPGAAESWTECPKLPAPSPVIESATERERDQALTPDGKFAEDFTMAVHPAPGEPQWRELALAARYQQGALPADRFLIAVTEDGSDPRLSPTSRVATVLARRGEEQWEATVRARADAKPLRIAVAAAVLTRDGLRPQAAQMPAAWQRPRL